MESLLVSHLNRNANLMISNPFVAPSTFPRQVGFCPKISWVKIHTGTQYLLSFLIWTVQRTSLLDALIVNISTLICDFTYCMSRWFGMTQSFQLTNESGDVLPRLGYRVSFCKAERRGGAVHLHLSHFILRLCLLTRASSQMRFENYCRNRIRT